MSGPEKQHAPRNRTLTLSEQARAVSSKRLLRPPWPASARELRDRVIGGDSFALLPQLASPRGFYHVIIPAITP